MSKRADHVLDRIWHVSKQRHTEMSHRSLKSRPDWYFKRILSDETLDPSFCFYSPSGLMNWHSDAQIATVRCMTVENGFSRHLCLNKTYYLFWMFLSIHMWTITNFNLASDALSNAAVKRRACLATRHWVTWKETIPYIDINQHNIRISRESAELWWLDDPEVRLPAETCQQKWVWMSERFAGENSFEISIPVSFSLSVARFSVSLVTHAPDTIQNVVRTLAHRFLQNTWQRRFIFECISIIKCLITQLANLNSFDQWVTHFYDGCICIYSILTNWPNREVPPQSS
jgi:hypothetical protein